MPEIHDNEKDTPTTMSDKKGNTSNVSKNGEPSAPAAGKKITGAIPEFVPLPDITDTSYMSARFQAPPRFSTNDAGEVVSAQLPQNADEAVEASASESITSDVDGKNHDKPATHSEPSKQGRKLFGKQWTVLKPQLPDELYEAATEHFLSSYRNPLDEEVVWKSPKVRIPIIWWILFFLSLLASVLVLAIMFLFPELVDIPHLHSISRPLLVLMVFVIVFVGWLVTFIRLRKPTFWNKFHTLYSVTGFLWGFGGVSGFSSLVVTAWIDASYTSSDVHDIVSLILPISLWTGVILVVPPIVAARLLPVWERHAPLMRLGVMDAFWGAYAGIILTLIAPYISRERPALSFVILVLAVLPTAGVFTAGLVVCLPIRWPISFTAYLNYVLGILLVSFGIAVLMSYVLVRNMEVVGSIIVTLMVLFMAGIGLWAILGISQAPDPLLRSNLENLQTWVDADVISPDEHEFMCHEDSVHEWGLTALRRGVFLAARDYYRAVMRLAFLDFGDEGAQDLSNVIRMTRRKLEAAGVPPCLDFESFSEAPIYPDLLS
ncbi:MAG: hypothetical protein IKS49_06405 [Actinomycetaceae bacterium]|nr:hypothetical protein [Actinomycetaceae bacterium]